MNCRGVLLPALFVTLLGAAYVANPVGVWKGTLESPVGPLPVQYTLTSNGTALAGTMELELGSFPLTEGTMRGDSVFFTADIEVVKLAHRGLVRGDTLSVAVHDGMEEMPVAVLIRQPAQ